MNSTKVTERGRHRGVYVLVVHDPAVDVGVLCDTLRTKFLVRDVDAVFTALERLPEPGLACVVCVVGGTIRAQEFLDLASRVAPEQLQQIVFVGPMTHDDVDVFERSKVNWLSSHAKPEETLKVVRAIVAVREP
jgi:hypothetical protein